MKADMCSLLAYLVRACRLGAAGNFPFYPVRFAVPVGEYLRCRKTPPPETGTTAKKTLDPDSTR